jgi:hypothetical protein
MLVITDGRASIPMGVAAYGRGQFWFWVDMRWLWGWRPLRSSPLGLKRGILIKWRPLRSIRLSRRRPLRRHFIQFKIVGGRNVGIINSSSILRTLNSFLLLVLQQFDGGKPLLWQGRNKSLVVKIRLKATKSEKVGPGHWGFPGASMYGLKEIIVHNVKLRTDVVGPQVANEPDGAGVQGRRTHVLPLARARLPFG